MARRAAERPAPRKAAPPLERPVRKEPPAPVVVPNAVEIFDEVEQGSEEWINLRLGVPTASNFALIMADGQDGEASKTRARYMRMLAGEILTGRPAEGKIITAAMQRGRDMEPEARQHYLDRHFVDLRQVGFIRRRLPSGRFAGCSPDAMIGDRKALEIKTLAPDLMIERLEKGAGMPPEHKAQVQGTMWVGDLEEVDLLLFYSGFPVAPKFTCWRDDHYIRELANAVEIFEFETRRLVEKIRRMGS